MVLCFTQALPKLPSKFLAIQAFSVQTRADNHIPALILVVVHKSSVGLKPIGMSLVVNIPQTF